MFKCGAVSLSEVKFLCELDHENIVKLYGFILRDNTVEILMEYAGKKNLSLYVNVFCVYAAMSKSSKQLQNFIEIQYGLHRNQWGKNKQQSSLKPLNHLKAKMIAISLR
jgi:serine/threonine protein kinase